MINRDTKHIASSILDEAAEWQVKLSSEAVTDADIASHMEWLLADPIHVEAEEIVAATMNVSTEFETAARKAFSDDFEAENVNQEEKPFWSRLLGSSAGLPSGIAIAAVAALLFFTIVPNTEQRNLPDTEQTYVAESGRVESVKLDDGSIIALFSNSEISASMSSDTRVVELKRGRAFFDVSSDKDRPFLVNTAARQVKVVGTRFEVVRGKKFERVSVNEGLVSVDTLFDQSTPEAASTPVLIEPGMVALYSGSQMVPMLSTKDANNVGAWSGGVLTYRNESLQTIVSVINDLFPDVPIRLADDSLASLNFSGTLVVSSSEEMARQLGEFLSLKMQLEDSGIILSSK